MTARSLAQEQRDYEIMVDLFEVDPPDTEFQQGYGRRLHQELQERGHTTLAKRLNAALSNSPWVKSCRPRQPDTGDVGPDMW